MPKNSPKSILKNVAILLIALCTIAPFLFLIFYYVTINSLVVDIRTLNQFDSTINVQADINLGSRRITRYSAIKKGKQGDVQQLFFYLPSYKYKSIKLTFNSPNTPDLVKIESIKRQLFIRKLHIPLLENTLQTPPTPLQAKKHLPSEDPTSSLTKNSYSYVLTKEQCNDLSKFSSLTIAGYIIFGALLLLLFLLTLSVLILKKQIIYLSRNILSKLYIHIQTQLKPLCQNKYIRTVTSLLLTLLFLLCSGYVFYQQLWKPNDFLYRQPKDFYSNSAGHTPLGRITSGQTIEFSFPVTVDNFAGFSLNLATYGRQLNSPLHICLTNEDGTLVKKFTLTRQDNVKDNSFRFFGFSPIKNSKGRRYNLVLTSPAPPADAYTLWTVINHDPLYRLTINKHRLENKSFAIRLYSANVSFIRISYMIVHILFIMCTLFIIFYWINRRFHHAFYRWAGNTAVIRKCAMIKLHKLYIIMALVFGLLLIFITPPFQMPDEQVHFYRAYQISKLKIWKDKDLIPNYLLEFGNKYEPYTKNQWLAINPASIKQDFSTPHRAAGHSKKETTKITSPYIPAVLGILIADIFSPPPIFLLYSARLFSLLIGISILATALYWIPHARSALFLLCLMPMTMYQISACSYDALTISVSILMISLLVNIACSKKVITPGKYFSLLLLTAILTICKPPYFLLCTLFLIIPFKQAKTLPRFLAAFAVILITIPIFLVIFEPNVTSTALALFQPTEVASQPQLQQPVTSLFVQLFDLGQAIANTVIQLSTLHFKSLIGILGWLDIYLPSFMYLYIPLFIIICSFMDTGKRISLNTIQRCILITVFVAIYLAIYVIFFICYKKPSLIIGIQGRYFIPIIPCLLLALKLPPKAVNALKFPKGVTNLFLISSTSLILICSLLAIINRYYFGKVFY